MVALLGTDTDRKIAATLDMPVDATTRERRRRKIPACAAAQNTPIVIPPELTAQLGKLSDGEIAKRLGVSQPTISKYRRDLKIECVVEFGSLPDEAFPLLGKELDSVIAKRYGVTRSCVSRRRNLLKIPACTNRSIPNLEQDVVEQLGMRSDSELARVTGLPRHWISQARKHRSIAPFAESESRSRRKAGEDTNQSKAGIAGQGTEMS
ncbi:hypothetical protein [Pseudomonas sp. MWU12-2323]|uniref:hypothetical protein n=1 Tax=Pseudomonas sp. MWU12-2323 TaxID=2651296 RepID=UPI00128C534C|nr:hypothetical protein [Pseudomonas sp. MWU12-2323]MPQ69249.1 hypothetical protein [Pseudomonas sp. MWU12-2323]